MLIQFKILWFEDSKEWYESAFESLKDHLEDKGFDVDSKHISNPENENIDEILEKSSNYNLILVDWEYNSKKLGIQIIKDLREKIHYTNIIFYSGQDKIKEEFEKNSFPGTYYEGREGLINEMAKPLIDYLLGTSLHPESMKSYLVSSLSQIDSKIYEIIQCKYEKLDDLGKKELINQIKKSLKNQQDDKNKKIKKLLDDDNNNNFLSEISTTRVFESMKRVQIIIKIIEQDNDNNFINMDIIKKLEDVVIRRNHLSHWKTVCKTDESIKLEDDGETYIFNAEEAKEIRTKINSGYEELEKYFEIILKTSDSTASNINIDETLIKKVVD